MEVEEMFIEEVWKGAFPLRISLAKIDIASNEIPADFYGMVSRNSYLPALLESVKKHFEMYVSTDYITEQIWFSVNGIPLKWHYPAGLLLDIHAPPKDGVCPLPFHIEVHFHRYPSDTLLPYSGIKSIRSIFQNNLKESSALLFGTSAPVMNLSRDQEETMWKSLSESNFKQFKEIGSEFTRPSKTDCRYLPVKFLSKDRGLSLFPILANDNFSLISAVKSVFPDFSGTCLCQGILLPSDSDLFWLWLHLSYADNFLYIVLLD